MSADIIPFIPRTITDRRPRDAAHLVRFPAPQVDDLVMGHADTAPCEYVPPCEEQYGDSEPA